MEPSPLASADAPGKIRVREKGESSVPAQQDQHVNAVQLHLLFWWDSITVSATKAVFFKECPADPCCVAFSFTYKTPWPIWLCTGCHHNVCVPSLEHEDPRCGVLHRTRLPNNSKHGCSLQAPEKNQQQLKEGLLK